MTSLAGFGEGLAGGLNTGMDIMAKARAEREARLLARAKAATGQSWLGGDQGPQAPMPGQPSMPKQMPMPGATPMPGAAPPNAGAGPAPPAPPPAAPPAAMPAGAGPAPGQALPGFGDEFGAGKGGPGAPPMSAVAAPQTQDPMQQDRQTLQSIAASIAQANPGIDGATLFEAVHQQIDTMKGLDTAGKEQLRALTNLYQAQYRYGATIQQNQSRERVADTRAEAQRDVAGTQAGAREYAADRGYQGRVESAQIGANARVSAASIAASARQYAADVGFKGKMGQEASRVYERTYNTVYKSTMDADKARVAAEAKLDAARIQMGAEIPAKAPAPGAKPVGKPSIVGKPPAAPVYPLPPKGKYRSPDAAGADFRAGKLSEEQFRGVLRRDFGIQ